MSNKNYFLDPARAAVYHESRPSFHAEALTYFHQGKAEIIYDSALDVGCGTGQSSVALAEWSKNVTAIDNSQSMLNNAVSKSNIIYQLADAENMPFAGNSFDLVFVASSFHWFEKRKFLNQVNKVLKKKGKFLIYDSYVHEGLSKDFQREFGERFPRPFHDVRIVQGELEFFDMKFVQLHQFNFPTEMTIQDIIKYFYNLSNVTAAIENGESADSALKGVEDLVKKHLTGSKFVFQVWLSEIIKP